MKRIRVSLGPWVGGIVRNIARTLLSPSQLWDAQGVWSREPGRLHGCFEDDDSGTQGVDWWKFATGQDSAGYEAGATTKGDLLFNANHNAVLSVFDETNTASAYSGEDDTASDKGFWYVTSSTTAGDFVTVNADVSGAPLRCHYWKDAGVLVQLSPIARPNGLDGVIYSWKPSTAVEYQGRLFLFADGFPILVLHPDWYDSGGKKCGNPHVDNASQSGSNYVRYCMNPDWIISGKPCMIGLDYYDTGTISAASGGSAFTGSGTTWSRSVPDTSPIGWGGQWTMLMPAKGASWATDDIYSRGYLIKLTSATNANVDAGDSSDSVDIRFPAGTAYKMIYPGSYAMGRFGEVWKNRLTFIEGREYAYIGCSQYNVNFTTSTSGLGVGTTAGSTTVTVTSGANYAAGRFTSEFKPGDKIYIGRYNTTSASSSISGDPFYFYGFNATRGGDTTTAENAYDEYTVVEVTDDDNLEISPAAVATRSAVPYAGRRLLSSAERRRLYFAGQPADIANSIAFDPYDWTVVNVNTTVIIGEDSDGDIVRLRAFEDRLIVFMDRAVYEVGGSVPIDPSILPPDFYVRRLSGAPGLFAYDALEVSDDGQILYYCSHDGVYRMYGSTVERIDDVVRDHENYPQVFSHFAWVDKRLYMLEGDRDNPGIPADDPYIWIFDTRVGGWSYTKRVNSNGAAPSTSPSETTLYRGSGKHGGIFSPFRGIDGLQERLLVGIDVTPTGGAGTVTTVTWASSAIQAQVWNAVGLRQSTTLLVAVGESGAISSSTDAATWTARTSGVTSPLNAVTYSTTDSLFVVGGGAGAPVIVTSADAVTWTSRTVPSGVKAIHCISESSGVYAAAGESKNTGSQNFIRSTDGTTWSAATTTGAGLEFYAMGNDGTTFVAVGNGVCYTSTDADTWTSRTIPAGIYRGIVWDSNTSLFIAVGDSGALATSPDGITWTSRTPAASSDWTSVAVSGSLIVAMADSGSVRCMSSADGVTWKVQNVAPSGNWSGVTYSSGLSKFVAVAGGGSDRAATGTESSATALEGKNEYGLTTMNYGTPPTDNTRYHGVKVQAGFVDAGTLEAKRVRYINLVDTNPLATDFDEVQFSVTSSEGPTTLTRNVDPQYSDSDHRKYRVSGTGGRGDTFVSAVVGDGVSPIGEIAALTMDIDIVDGRSD